LPALTTASDVGLTTAAKLALSINHNFIYLYYMVPLYSDALTYIAWLFLAAIFLTIYSFWRIAISHSLYTRIVLTISILLNTFFVAGFCQSQYHNKFQYWDYSRSSGFDFIKRNLDIFSFDLAMVCLILVQVHLLYRAIKRRHV